MDRWFGNELIAEWNKNVKIEEIQSNNGLIHIEVYKTDNINNPTLVFSHGSRVCSSVTPFFDALI